MSTKLVKDGTIDVSPITWQNANSASGTLAAAGSLYAASGSHATSPFSPSSRLEGRPFENENSQSTPDIERILELELHIRALEREAEQRSQAAHEKGLQQGLEQGRQQGDASARQQLAAPVDELLQKLSRTIEEISGLKQRFRRQAEEDVVKLALAIARRVLHRELTIDPGAMLGLVKAALDQLDAREVHRLRVHPDQAAALHENFERMGLPRRLQVEGDPSLERGAAIFETTRGTLDASAESQLGEIERGFTDLVKHVK